MRVYPHLMQPEDYPEFTTRWAKATTRSALDNKTQFAALRRFTEEGNKLTDINEKLDLYTKEIEMGKVVWPFVSTLLADNFEDLVKEIRKRGLYLFDFWGYVPGTNTAGQSWGQYAVEHRALEILHNILGDHFLGTDNGEQDGRYIGAYAHMLYPDTEDRKKQYINFRNFFDKLADDMGHFLTVLCSLNYGHYFAAMGDHIMVGAETAQALPNSNLWYAYLRGAGKQYGLLWFGNASVWNRFGWKNYTASGDEGTYQEHGPESGTSLSLLRRLLYTHYAYNCSILGYESGWFYAEELNGDKEGHELAKTTPIGDVQHGCVGFVDEHPDAGVLYTPVAIMLDFFNGWTFPRHLYTNSVYKTWGNIPYKPGDHQIHALYSMIFPGYENAGFYHDERGFLTPTPFGDAFEILFNDARREVIGQYALLIAAGSQLIDQEVGDKLESFVRGGGHLVVFGDQISGSPVPEWLGIKTIGEAKPVANATVTYNGVSYQSDALDYADVVPVSEAEVLAECGGKPFIVRRTVGQGIVDVIASPFGLDGTPLQEPAPVTNQADEDIPFTFDFCPAVKAFLADCFNEQKIVDVGNASLQYTTGYQDETHVVVSISNNGFSPEKFDITASSGAIKDITEWELPPCSPDTLGYYPAVVKDTAIAAANQNPGAADVINPGDVRFFEVTMDPIGGEILEPVEFADSSNGAILSLWDITNLREEILTHERLRQHFSGVKIEAKYLMERDTSFLEKEGAFFKRQKLDGIVDFIGLLNFYPDLTLIGNIESRRDQSVQAIEDVFRKMALMGMKKALFALHRNAENNFTVDQAHQSFLNTYSRIADIAAGYGISLLITTRPLKASTILWNLELPGVSSKETIEFVRSVGKGNVSFAFDTCHALMVGEDLTAILEEHGDEIDLICASTPEKDGYGQFYNMHRPIAGSVWEEDLKPFFEAAARRDRRIPVCLNTRTDCWDTIYRDSRLL